MRSIAAAPLLFSAGNSADRVVQPTSHRTANNVNARRTLHLLIS
jgi:hypothetical protein